MPSHIIDLKGRMPITEDKDAKFRVKYKRDYDDYWGGLDDKLLDPQERIEKAEMHPKEAHCRLSSSMLKVYLPELAVRTTGISSLWTDASVEVKAIVQIWTDNIVNIQKQIVTYLSDTGNGAKKFIDMYCQGKGTLNYYLTTSKLPNSNQVVEVRIYLASQVPPVDPSKKLVNRLIFAVAKSAGGQWELAHAPPPSNLGAHRSLSHEAAIPPEVKGVYVIEWGQEPRGPYLGTVGWDTSDPIPPPGGKDPGTNPGADAAPEERPAWTRGNISGQPGAG